MHGKPRIKLPLTEEAPLPTTKSDGMWTIPIGGIPAGRARLPIEAPLGHMGLKGGLKRRDHAPKLIQGQTGQIQHLKRAALDVGES